MAQNPRTVNRGTLRRQIEKGLIEAKVSYSYTDDYAWDAATNFGKTDWLPARVRAEGERQQDAPSGHINFYASDFRGYGHAYKNGDGTISLSFGYRCYELRQKAEVVTIVDIETASFSVDGAIDPHTSLLSPAGRAAIKAVSAARKIPLDA